MEEKHNVTRAMTTYATSQVAADASLMALDFDPDRQSWIGWYSSMDRGLVKLIALRDGNGWAVTRDGTASP